MQSSPVKKVLLVALAGGLIAFLFFNGRNESAALSGSTPHANAPNAAMTEGAFDFSRFEKSVLDSLQKREPARGKEIEGLKAIAKDAAGLERLAVAYDSLKQPALAGHYYRQLAQEKPTEANWRRAGSSFYAAMTSLANPEEDAPSVKYFAKLAMEGLDNALKLNPGNLDTKAELAAVNVTLDPYTPETNETMTGVGLLRSITQVDSNNRKALYMLGILSMQSGQYGKAAERFRHLTRLRSQNDPEYPYYYRYLGQALAQDNKKDEAVTAFKQYKSLVAGNSVMMEDADQLIHSVEHAH